MNQFQLLKSRRFSPIFATQFLGAFNDNIYKNSLVILIAFSLADKTSGNSSILVIVAAGLFILPFFLFSALAGQIADKYEKSLLIQCIKIAEILIMCMAAVGFLVSSVPVLMFVLFLMGTQSSMFGPLKYGILPQHLQESELIGGNGMIQMGTYMAILMGTILGGILIAIKPEGRYLVSIIIITIACLGWLASRQIPEAKPPDPTLDVNWNIFTETLKIIGFARENRTVMWSIIAISWFWFYGATFLSLMPSYTRDVLSGDEHVATLLLTAFSVGIGSGSLLCEKLSNKRIEMGLIPLGAIGLSLFALDMYFTGTPSYLDGTGKIMSAGMFISNLYSWRVLVDLALMGAFGGLFIVPLYALIQNLSDVNHRARIIAANNILNALFMVLSALLTVLLITLNTAITDMFMLVSLLNIIVVGIVIYQIPDFMHRFRILLRLSNSA